jgi:hypothetical protein
LLKIDPLQLIFVGASVVVDLVADAQAKDPRINLRLKADDMDVGGLLAQVEVGGVTSRMISEILLAPIHLLQLPRL